MAVSRDMIIFMTLMQLKDSLNPFEIGLRRKELFQRIISDIELFFGNMSNDEYNSLNMRFQRVLDSLVKDGTLIRDSQGHKKTYYRLEKEAYIQFLDERGILKDRENFEKLIDELMQTFPQLPPPKYRNKNGKKKFYFNKKERHETKVKKEII